MSTPQFAPFDAEQSMQLKNAQAISTISKVNPQWGQYAQQAAQQYNLPVYQIVDTIQRESNFNPGAHAAGSSAEGLGQFTHSTAGQMQVNPLNPQSSIMGVGKYLAYLRDNQGVPGDMKDLTEAYILGPGGYKTLQAGGSPVGADQLPSALNFLSQHGDPSTSNSGPSPLSLATLKSSPFKSMLGSSPQLQQATSPASDEDVPDDDNDVDNFSHKLAEQIRQEEAQS